MFLPNQQSGMDLLLKHKRVIFDVNFVGNATASLVQLSSDVPGSVFLQSSGVDQVTAQDSAANFTTLSTAKVGVLLQGPDALGGKLNKLFSVSVVEMTAVAGTLTVAKAGVSTTGITSSGNLAITIAGSTADLSSQTITYRVTLECSILAQK